MDTSGISIGMPTVTGYWFSYASMNWLSKGFKLREPGTSTFVPSFHLFAASLGVGCRQSYYRSIASAVESVHMFVNTSIWQATFKEAHGIDFSEMGLFT
jgi:hypothetical protein